MEKGRNKLLEHITKAVKYDDEGNALNPMSGAFATQDFVQIIHTEFNHKISFEKKNIYQGNCFRSGQQEKKENFCAEPI